MAGRSSDKAQSGKALAEKAVEDASRFLFELDAAQDVTPVIVNRVRKAPADPLKPHHHDHRGRLRKRFDDAGPNALSDYELLELMLFRNRADDPLA